MRGFNDADAIHRSALGCLHELDARDVRLVHLAIVEGVLQPAIPRRKFLRPSIEVDDARFLFREQGSVEAVVAFESKSFFRVPALFGAFDKHLLRIGSKRIAVVFLTVSLTFFFIHETTFVHQVANNTPCWNEEAGNAVFASLGMIVAISKHTELRRAIEDIGKTFKVRTAVSSGAEH